MDRDNLKSIIFETINKVDGLELNDQQKDILTSSIIDSVQDSVDNVVKNEYIKIEQTKIENDFPDLKAILEWGEKNIPTNVLDGLKQTHQGISTIKNFMNNKYSQEDVLSQEDSSCDFTTEDDLMSIMSNRNYWENNDVESLEKVEQEFKRIYDASK